MNINPNAAAMLVVAVVIAVVALFKGEGVPFSVSLALAAVAGGFQYFG